MAFKVYDEQKIKVEVEKEFCNIHKAHPTFISTPEGFRLKTCCEEFGDACDMLARKLIDLNFKQNVENHITERLKE